LIIYLPRNNQVRFQVTFESTWSETTHPYQFPPNPHWSGLIGATHSDGVTFWEVGGITSDGIRFVAETGNKFPFTTVIDDAIEAQTAFSKISGSGINPSPGSVSVKFSISRDYPLVTLVSMIAPSPDWFVGINSVSVLDGNGNWLEELVITLYLYDAGTDSGLNYTAANAPTNPRILIATITTSEFPGSDVPFGTFTFTKD